MPPETQHKEQTQSLALKLQDPFIRKALLKTGAVLFLLFAAVGVLGVGFEAQLLMATSRIAEAIGLSGLLSFVLISDFLVSPVPPDLVLVVIAKSTMREMAWFAVPALGFISTLAGNLGWWVGWKLGDHRVSRTLFGAFREKNRENVAKYGKFAVALGALTPLPFSITCWTAGVLKMPWRDFFLASLLRVPRFALGYFIIISSDTIANWFK